MKLTRKNQLISVIGESQVIVCGEPITEVNVKFELTGEAGFDEGQFRNLELTDMALRNSFYVFGNFYNAKGKTSISQAPSGSLCKISDVKPTCYTNSIKLDFGSSCKPASKIYLTNTADASNKTSVADLNPSGDTCNNQALEVDVTSSHARSEKMVFMKQLQSKPYIVDYFRGRFSKKKSTILGHFQKN